MFDNRLSTRAIPRRLLWTWLALLALSQAADVLTTWRSLSLGRAENNPFVAAALGSGHLFLFAFVKLTLVAAFGILLLGGRSSVLTAARILVIAFSGVALANLLAPVLA